MIGIMTAAGKGTRMKALTGADIPKVLLKLKDKSIIEYGIESMINMGVSGIYIVINENYLDDFKFLLKKYPLVNIKAIPSNNHIMESVEELSKFVLANNVSTEENFIYWLADNIFIGEDHKNKLKKLDSRMNNDTAMTGFLLTHTDTPSDFITLNADGTFSEKPKFPETNKSAVGVFLVNKKALEDTNRREINTGQKEFNIWDSWMKEHNIISEEISDIWVDVGTPERYLKLKNSFK